MRARTLQSMVTSAVMAAFGITLPVVFHSVGLGSKFLPMLLPILLNGFLSSLPWAVFVGVLVPLLSGLLTGMPPFYPPVAPIMSAESALMAATAASLYRISRPRIWPALTAAVIVDRTASLVLMWLAARSFALPPTAIALTALLQGLPGVALQLAVVPLILRALSMRKGVLFQDDDESKTPVL